MALEERHHRLGRLDRSQHPDLDRSQLQIVGQLFQSFRDYPALNRIHSLHAACGLYCQCRDATNSVASVRSYCLYVRSNPRSRRRIIARDRENDWPEFWIAQRHQALLTTLKRFTCIANSRFSKSKVRDTRGSQTDPITS